MWRLILYLIILPFFDSFSKKEVILILNDCENWELYNYRVDKNHFSYSKEFKDFPFVSMGHAWIDEEYKLSTKSLNFSEIIDSDPIYTSQLSLNDWYSVQREYEKIFILIPEDYCSEKRVLHGYEFTLYEVNLYVTADTDDVIEPLNLLPLPEVDSVRRKKKD